jgi:hypothetical protein
MSSSNSAIITKPYPKVTSSPKVTFGPPKVKSLGKVRARYLPSKVSSLASKGKIHHIVSPKVWVMSSTCGIQAPMKAQSRLVPPKRPPSKVLQRQVNSPSKGLKSNVSCQVKSHLIQEPPKHVHQKPFQIKQVLKDPMQLVKFRYGRVVIIDLLGESFLKSRSVS